MKYFVTPGPDGQISHNGVIQGHPAPERVLVVEVERNPGPHEVFYLIEGALVVHHDYRGSGPWYDQKATSAGRLHRHDITETGIVPPNDLGHPVTSGWENMAMAPRAETAAEKKAREKAEAEAAAAKEAERKASRVLSAVQIRKAAVAMGIREAIEALVANPETPIVFRDYWEYSAEYHRSSPVWVQALPLLGASEADLDRLYDLGEAL